MNTKEIYVWLNFSEEDILVGKLWSYARQGRESASFEYDKTWLSNPEGFALEPALHLTQGKFHTENQHKIFGSRSLGTYFDAQSRK